MDNPTRTLMRIIGSPLVREDQLDAPIESVELFQYAFRNNVEMLYCRRLEEAGILNALIEECKSVRERQQQTLRTVCRLSTVLQDAGIPHAVTKTLRPYPGTPNDIDLLYLGELQDYEDAAQYLTTQGYKITGPNPMQYELFDEQSGVEFNKYKEGGRFYIDFYRELAADYMPYMDSDLLRRHIERVPVDGCDRPVQVFVPKAEMVILALHSILMHRTVPLEVVYTYSYLLAEMSRGDIDELWSFVKASHAEPAMAAVLSIMAELYDQAFGCCPDPLSYLVSKAGTNTTEVRELRKEGYKMPHIAALSTFVISVLAKTRGKRARNGFFRELAHMMNPVFAVEVIYHMLSKKRIARHSKHV